MSVSWETFKAHLGFWQNVSVVYIDEEGSEIPIDSDWEFQEALRLAKMNKKRLNLILYDDKLHKIEKKFETPIEYKAAVSPGDSLNLLQSLNVEKLSNPLTFESNLKDNICHYGDDVPPEWFTQYMKKFKKDLLHELKSDIIDIVENVVAKSKILPSSKSYTADGLFSFDKSETRFSPITCQPSCSTALQNKKKRKVSEKDLMDLTKQREVKVPKRLEKLREKSERLEKLYNTRRVALEEKKRLLEKILYFKQKLDRMGVVISDKRNMRKSVFFRERDIFLFLTPSGEFTLNVSITNDGKIDWYDPWLLCYDFAGLQVEESSITLPRLRPKQSYLATLQGKADKTVGLHHFKCILKDGVNIISPEFTCWAIVDFFEDCEEYCKILINSSESVDILARSDEFVDTLIDFEKIAHGEKKMEENILEIEKRLKDLDLLRSPSVEKATLKNDGGKSKEMNTKKAEELEIGGCDLLQISEEKEKNWKERLEQEEVVFGVDCLGLATESSDACSVKMSEINDGNEKIKKDDESESSCDSELSVICISEEDETFFVVPLPSKTPSPAQSVLEDKTSLSGDSVVKPTIICVEPDIIRINNRLIKPNSDTTNDFYPSQQSPARMRRSSLVEISESKPKKMKSESTEYRFTTANLTQPTFTPIPEGFLEKRPSKFTFTGEKKEKSHSEGIFEGKSSKFTFVKEKDIKVKNVPKTDALGRVIYAVNINGYCLPVRDVFGSEEHCRIPTEENRVKGEQKNQNRTGKKSDRFNEVPPVNIVPNAFINGASNVASLAINTAKSVINNLQSAFVIDGKSELKKQAYEEKKQISLEDAMCKLYEMGFSNFQLNGKLLLMNDNHLVKVIEELIRIKENSSDQSQ